MNAVQAGGHDAGHDAGHQARDAGRGRSHDADHGAIRAATGTTLIVAGLYLLALLIRLLAASQIPFPATQPSAYFADVAQNLVQGDGLVSHAVWSYATGPLVVPKPAFELWLPMSSLVSAVSMAAVDPSWWAAQLGSALLGALVAPLAWAVGRGASRAAGLDGRRGAAVAITSGLLAAILAPLVLAAAVPDSYTPYLVFTLMSALLVPRVLGLRGDAALSSPRDPESLAGAALGLTLGFAYLSRQEAIWLGLTVLLMLTWVLRWRPAGGRLREAIGRLWPVVVGGLVVVVPWLVRNLLEFGSALPGQAVENMFLVRNEDIFAFAERPDAGRYLEQGLATVLWNPVAAAWSGFIEVLLLQAFPIGVVGLVCVVAMRRSAALRRPTALLALLGSGALTFVSTVLLFPVATRWGTFMHASGPLVVALLVTAVLGTDALLARVSAMRQWQRPNVVIGPIALIVLATGLAILQLSLLSSQARQSQVRHTSLAASIARYALAQGRAVPATLITDQPMWLAGALDRSAIALPDEDMTSLMELSRHFGAPWVVVVGERGRYPGALLEEAAAACLDGEPVALEDGTAPAWLFPLADTCPGT